MSSMWTCGLWACWHVKSTREEDEAYAPRDAARAVKNMEEQGRRAGYDSGKARTPAARTDGVHGDSHSTAQARSAGAGIGPSSAALQSASSQQHGKFAAPKPSHHMHHADHASMQRQERTLRAILHKAKQLAASATDQHKALLDGMSSPQATQEVKANDPELARLRDQLVKACASSGPEALTRVQQVLLDARRWLQPAGSAQAASALLSAAEEALLGVEALLQRCGPMSQWGPDEVAAALALLQLYAQLAQHALVPHASAAHLRRAVRKLLLGRPHVLGLLVDLLSHVHFSQDYLARCAAKHEALGAALVLWELLHGLVRFSTRVVGRLPATAPQSTADAKAGATDQQLGAGGVATAAVQQAVLAGAVQKLTGLLEPGTGTAARLLDQPITEHTAAVQLAVMHMLRHLFEFGGAQLLEVPGLAQHYAALHFNQFCHFFASAGVDTGSAAAELAKVHLKVLRAMAGCGSPAVRAELKALHVVGWLLDEFSLESTLLCAEQAEAAARAAHEDAASSENGSESDDGDEMQEEGSDESQDGDGRSPSAGGEAGQRMHGQPPSQAHGHGAPGAKGGHMGGGGAGAFRFTYDLNEDLERLMALEEKLGRAVDLEGLEYDDEARRLMTRDVLAETAAAAAAEGGDGTGAEHRGRTCPSDHPQGGQVGDGRHPVTATHAAVARLNLEEAQFHTGGCPSHGDPHTRDSVSVLGSPGHLGPPSPGSSLPTGRSSEASRPSFIPKLSLTSVRSAASSHVFLASPMASSGTLHPMKSTGRSHLAPHPPPVSHGGSAAQVPMLRLSGARGGETDGDRSSAREAEPLLSSGRPVRPLLAPLPLSGSSGRPLAPLSPTRLPRLPQAHLHHTHMSPLSSRGAPAAGGPSPHITPGLLAAAAPGSAGITTSTPGPPLHGGMNASRQQSNGALGVGEEPSFYPQHASSADVSATHPTVASAQHSTITLGGGLADASGAGGPLGPAAAGAGSRVSDEAEAVTCGEAGDMVPELKQAPGLAVKAGSLRAAGMTVPVLNLGVLSSARGGRGGAPGSSARQGSGARADTLSSLRAPNTATTIADSAGDPRHAPQLSPGAHSSSGPDALCSESMTSGARPTYAQAVAAQLWFHDASLHVSLLQLLLELLITPAGSLDPDYVHAFPTDVGAPNVEHLMAWHFAGPAGSAVLPQLVRALSAAATAATTPAPPPPAATGAVGGAAGAPSNGGGSARGPPPLFGPMPPPLRLLRLLSRSLFDPARLHDLVFHSRGAYGGIFRAKLSPRFVPPAPSSTVMVKAIELPSSGFDRCLLRDVYEEVAILERYATAMLPPVALLGGDAAGSSSSTSGSSSNVRACAGVCQLLDYGLTQDAYWIVMRRYRCSLADWRARQTNGPGVPRAAAMYLGVLLQVVDALDVLAADTVVHFDLKAANVLVEPRAGVTDGQLYGAPPAPPCEPPFAAVLADFGEARAYRNAEEAFTARNRGTEVYKSPEMLLLNTQGGPGGPGGGSAAPSARPSPSGGVLASGRSRAAAAPSVGPPNAVAALRHSGVGLASDIWSFGCLAYEVLSGQVLFSDTDYASVTHRVAFGRGPHLELTPTERARLAATGPAGSSGTAAASSGDAGDTAAVCAGVEGVGMGPEFVSLVQWVLARDPAARPSLAQIRERLMALRAQCVACA